MPRELGEPGMIESAVLGCVSQGLRHEVIAIGLCCKMEVVSKGITATSKLELELRTLLFWGVILL